MVILLLITALIVTLHSILDIFQSASQSEQYKTGNTLHSILDIFQCKVCFRNLIRSHPLHSILVIFQFIFMISYYFFTIFTFHSGYILIFQIFRLSYSMPLFTFHSGYILIILANALFTIFLTLHSILVIF